MSAATVPVALCEALEEQRVRPGALLLMPGFGGGLSYCAHLVRWGSRTTPLKSSASSCRRTSVGAADHPRVPGAQDAASAAAPTKPFA